MLVLLYGQTRIFYTMARDGLLPSDLRQGEPEDARRLIANTLVVGTVAAGFAGFTGLDFLGDTTNVGTLVAFMLICVTVIYLRFARPNLHRPFKMPTWLIAIIAVLGAAMHVPPGDVADVGAAHAPPSSSWYSGRRHPDLLRLRHVELEAGQGRGYHRPRAATRSRRDRHPVGPRQGLDRPFTASMRRRSPLGRRRCLGAMPRLSLAQLKLEFCDDRRRDCAPQRLDARGNRGAVRSALAGPDAAALKVREANWPEGRIQKSQLLSIKTGGCPEDCGYCSQSAHFKTGLAASKLMEVDAVVAEARTAKANGADRFCMGAAWRSLKDRDMPAVCAMISAVKAEGLETCVTLGMLEEGQAEKLKDAGLDYYNHNLDSSREYYWQGHLDPHRMTIASRRSTAAARRACRCAAAAFSAWARAGRIASA